MSTKIEIPLDIEGVDIKDVIFTKQDEIVIVVESQIEGTKCHRCGQVITKYHGSGRPLILRHLPILGKKTYLSIKPRRYLCEHCKDHPTTTQVLPWYDARSSCTKAYEKHVMLMLLNSTIIDVSRKEDLAYDVVEGLLDRYIGQQVDWEQITCLHTLGIDEIALKKGHGDFVTVVTSRLESGQIQLLGILANREKDTVKAFLSSIPNELRKTLTTVCTDLYEGYINAAQEVFGDSVMIVADRFHVARLYRKAVDRLRIKEMRRLKKELSQECYQELENAMWIIRKKPEELSDTDKVVINKISEWAPDLALAYVFSSQLTRIFDKPLTPSDAQWEIAALISLAHEYHLDCFDALSEHMTVITNYFVARKNSGFVEGLNNKIKVIKRRCYGIFNRIHLFQRISLDLGGYEQFA